MKFIYLLLLICINCHLIPKPEKGIDAFLKFIGFKETSYKETNLVETSLSISAILPKTNSTDVFRNTNIFVGFNKTLVTFDEKSFAILDQSNVSHTGKISISSNFLIFIPDDNFKEDTLYTISIKKEIGLESDFSSSFTTGKIVDNTPPSVLSTSPLEGDKDFPLNAAIVFNFSETIDPTSITSETFTISGGISADRSVDAQIANLKPKNNLSELSPYIVTLKAGVKDLAGNKTTTAYSILFSTGSSIVKDSCVYDEGLFSACLYK